MSREIEIEWKNVLRQDEFEKLCQFHRIGPEDFICQHNDYFDTPSWMLKDRGCALRIRRKGGLFTLTLKQPHPEGLLEIHQSLTEREAVAARTNARFPNGDVTDTLRAMDIPIRELSFLGTLSTKRARRPYRQGVLMFDHSYYLGAEDYELEFECRDKTDGEAAFAELLRSFQIPRRRTKNKIRRFFDRKTLCSK